jgi:hypothetical protein
MSSFSIPGTRVRYSSRLGWLPASLALNLILIGIMAAWVWNMPPRARQPLVTWQREMIPSLAPDDAAMATDAAARIADAQSAGDIAVHAQYNKIRSLLAAEPLDHSALQAAFDQIATIRNNQQLTIGNAFRDELSSVSADGRSKILAAMEREAVRWHPTPDAKSLSGH